MNASSRQVRLRLIVYIASSTLLAYGSAYRGFFHLFSYSAQYDDTGFMLSLIQGFNARGALYRETFSQYGPFYSEFYFLAGRVLGLPINQDGIRWFALALWVLSSVVGGLVAYRVTRSVWLALVVQALAFHVLDTLVAEPGHPISLVAVICGALALALNTARSKEPGRGQAVVAGALLGALLMTKLNLGVFAVAAVGTAWIYCLRQVPFGRSLRWAVALLFGCLAFFLVKPLWPPQARVVFITYFVATLFGVLVSAGGGKWIWPRLWRFAFWTLAAMAITSALSIFGVVLTGTGWGDLFRGLILQPMKLGDVFTVVPTIEPKAATVAVVSLLAACACRLSRTASPPAYRRICFAVRLVFVGFVIGWLMEWCQAWTVLPLLWIAALPRGENGNSEESAADLFGRLSLVLLAVGQLLGIYPVAGSQIGIPFFLAVLCTIPIAGSLFVGREKTFSLGARISPQFALTTLTLAILSIALASSWKKQKGYGQRRYRHSVPLNLPGARLLRVDRITAATYRCLAANLQTCSPSYVCIPGMNSLYGWSERPFPTGFNTTMNFALLSEEEQRSIVEVGRRCRPFALIANEHLLFDFWVKGRFVPSGPLMNFMRQECSSNGRIRGYDFMSLKGEPVVPLTYCAVLGPAGSSNQPGGQITLIVPGKFASVRSASLFDLSKDKQGVHRHQVQAHFGPTKEDGEVEGNRQFVFTNPKPALLTAGATDGFLVQIWDDADRLIADLPFAKLREMP